MRRRSKAGGEPLKARRRRAATPKRRNGAKTPRRSSSAAGMETKIERLTRERNEALEQQTATSEVLKVISRSAFDLRTVLDTLLQSAARLCEADKGTITQRKGDTFYRSISYGFPAAFAEYVKDRPVEMGRDTATGRALLEGKVVHIPDVEADPDYAWKEAQRLGAFRTILGVPMLREGIPIGVLALARSKVRPFTDKQIELVATFADQAVIAIENVRLFEAEQQRSRELAESLEQQTATSEVLRVISTSPSELKPVFGAILENGARLCEANFGILALYENGAFHVAGMHNVPETYAEYRRLKPVIDLGPQSASARMAVSREVIHYLDYAAEVPDGPVARLAGARSVVTVPMLKDNELAGAIYIYRQEVRAFTDKQIALLENFAAQAVIAIENTRLLNELRQRTDDLSEALERQTATSDVLRVISSSPSELAAVFTEILENATRVCDAQFGLLDLCEDGAFLMTAMHNVPAAFGQAIAQRGRLFRPDPLAVLARVAATKEPLHVADFAEDAAYKQREPSAVRMVELGGGRTVLLVPMLKGEELIGVIAIYRQQVRPFTDKQIALVQSLAAQAVIAIENARLLNELRESLQQQTATADVLKVISRSAFDLQSVLNTLIESASRLCKADMAAITNQDGAMLRLAASYGYSPELSEYMSQHPIPSGRGSIAGRVLLEGRTVHVPDVMADPEYEYKAGAEAGGIGTMLGVPLVRESSPIGVLMLLRRAQSPFTGKQIELAETFADQAAIAIENVRLLDVLRHRTDESLGRRTTSAWRGVPGGQLDA